VSSETDLSDWTARPSPGGRELSGTRVILEPLDWRRHGDSLYDAIAGEANVALWQFIPFGPFTARDEFENILEFVRQDQGWATHVIVSAETRAALGTASYMRIREPHGSVEIGCVVFGDALQRTPEATEALALMAGHVFDDLGYRRYEWKCNNANAASKRAAERFGFRFEGVFRNDMIIRGRNRDTAWYSILDREWPALKSALDQWLAPENFDATGKQRARLEAFRAI
jgi:RimJ/RimL family protein N-acetyltransferase